MNGRKLSYYFTLQSPWSYLGHVAAMDVAARYDLEVIWKPTDLGQVFPESGGLPLAKRHPKRQAYRTIELQRWRRERGLPLNVRPAHWPLANTLADRCVVAIARQGAPPDRFVRLAFAAVWSEDRDVADSATLAPLLAEAGHDAGIILADAATDKIEDLYAANAQAALDAGVFGAPTYILDGEPFWGQDRLTLLEEALRSGRPPFTA